MTGIASLAAAVADDDMDLVSAVRQGDDRAFEELYARYHPRIAGYVCRMVKDHARAEDVTQEVFFSALRRMRATERPIAFRPWIYEIARNACIDVYRRGSRAEEVAYDAGGGLGAFDSLRLVSSEPAPEDAVECKQQLDDLCGAFGGLSRTHHEILVLRELEGLSYREIGERLGMTRAAVESTLFRARRRLTEEYDELVSGRRCRRVQSIVSSTAVAVLGTRDRRNLARHLATCQACRRHAADLGVDVRVRPSRFARIAGLLPFPLVLGRARTGGAGSSFLPQASATLGWAAEPVAVAWNTALAAAAAVVVAAVGAGPAADVRVPDPRPAGARPAAAEAPAQRGVASRAGPRSARAAADTRGAWSVSDVARGGATRRVPAPIDRAGDVVAAGATGVDSSPAAPAAGEAPSVDVGEVARDAGAPGTPSATGGIAPPAAGTGDPPAPATPQVDAPETDVAPSPPAAPAPSGDATRNLHAPA